MTPQEIADAILNGATRTGTDLRSALDLTDEVFDALTALAGPREDYAWLDDPAEREWLIALDPQDVVANAHRWYEWVAQFGGGLGDSVIREAAFTKASNALGIDYDDLYDAWLNRVPVTP